MRPPWRLAVLACCALLSILSSAALAQHRAAPSAARRASCETCRQSRTNLDARPASFLQDAPQGDVMEDIAGPYVEGYPPGPGPGFDGPGPHGDCGCDDCWQDYCGGDCCVQDACCGAGCRCGWYAGAEVFWAQPRIKDNNAYSVFTQDFTTGVLNQTVVTAPYDYDYQATPRIWLGYADCCGFGVRASWWEFEEDADPVVVPFGGTPAGIQEDVRGRLASFVEPPGTFSASQRLELELADFEFTNGFDLCGGWAVVAYGLRYVRYASETREQKVSSGGPFFVQGSFFDTFDGIGPTVALEFSRPLGCNLTAYGNLRGTIALGERETSATGRQFLSLTGEEPFSLSRTADEVQAVGEIQLGLQWNFCRCWFVRGGWQAQYWDDAAEVGSFVGGSGPCIVRGDIGVHGFNLAVGYRR